MNPNHRPSIRYVVTMILAAALATIPAALALGAAWTVFKWAAGI